MTPTLNIPTSLAIFAALLLPPLAGQAAAEPTKPNIIVILADDLGYGDVGCYGSKEIRTPHLDRMAAEGMRFTSFYAQAFCGPSRAALMTGCYPLRLAEVGNKKHHMTVPHARETLLSEVLKSAGYVTAQIGKWDLAGHEPDHFEHAGNVPLKRGFDFHFGTPASNDKWSNTAMFRNGAIIEKPVDLTESTTKRYADETIRFIRERQAQPFFIYLCPNMPHTALHAGTDFRGKSPRGLFGDVVEELDQHVGRILAALRSEGIEKNTLVFFTSDNGPWLSQKEHGGSAGPLRGGKTSTWEGGVRVPAIAWAPGRIAPGRTCDRIASTLDLLPTLTKLASAKLPENKLDGRDLSAWLLESPPVDEDTAVHLYHVGTHLQAVRQGRWKLHLARPYPVPWLHRGLRRAHVAEADRFEIMTPLLYDLTADIGEKNDVAAQHPEVVKSLLALAEQARTEIGDYDRIGSRARFFDEGQQRPDKDAWKSDQNEVPKPKAKRDAAKVSARTKPLPKADSGSFPVDFTYREAIGPERGVTRRDPSDVIKAGDKYFVWYSKVTKGPNVTDYPSGYSADVWFATSPDGLQWTEQGEAIGKGGQSAWDERGVFTPNILRFCTKYYLYYTAVSARHNKTTPTRIGLAVADDPAGPWKKFEGNPVLSPSDDSARFDSMRVDDAALLVREDKIWFFYKGRTKGKGPTETKMGVAFADSPTGPFTKHGEPLHGGHEVMIWPQDKGVASLATAAGPRTVYFAANGLHFEPKNAVTNHPSAPGAFRSDDFENNAEGKSLGWGISHSTKRGDLFLMRFDCKP